MTQSTTQKGNQFRDLVCDLLRTQHPDAEVELRLGGTKVDILFRRDDFGCSTVFGVECKDYDKPLTKTMIEREIYPTYQPLLDKGELSRVLIVSRHPLGADASAFVQTWPNVSHQTYEQLAQSLIGMREYISALAELRPTDETDYIEARFEDLLGSATEQIDAWVAQEEGTGLAILGGYGQGKTSLARRIASEYAKRHLANPVERMPILLRLGEVVHETQLEGLFGKEFTSRHRTTGYRFQTLEHLNRSGRLLVLLDGFDEMKHAMTQADFLANFREFNRLLTGRAKVILLGRPNALPSDERELVFRGKVRVGEQVVPSAQFVPWRELKLAFFSEAESRALLTSALALLIKKYDAERTYAYPQSFLSSRVNEVFQLVQNDLLRRPVHVQLLAEVAANPQFDLRGFNEYKLYDHFIRQMVQRDTVEKPARRAIALDPRLAFQRELAWWAWRRVGTAQGCFFRHELPADLLRNFPDGNSIDLEGKRNEYIVSTLTEEKESGVLFFAHRSFQEFLVAEYLRLTAPKPTSHADYSAFLTADIIGFLQQAPSTDFVIGWYDTLRSSPGPVKGEYLKFLASHTALQRHVVQALPAIDDREFDAWTIFVLYFGYQNSIQGSLADDELLLLFHKILRYGQSRAAAAATLALLNRYKGKLDPQALGFVVASVIERCLRFARTGGDANVLAIDKGSIDFASTWLGSKVEKIFPKQGEIASVRLQFEFGSLVQAAQLQLNDLLADENPLIDANQLRKITPVAVDAPMTYARIDKTLREQHGGFLNSRRSNFNITSVDRARPRSQFAMRPGQGSPDSPK